MAALPDPGDANPGAALAQSGRLGSLSLLAPAFVPHLLPATCRLPDGTIGYYMRRADDCWRSAVATTLQVAPDGMPDSHTADRLRQGEPLADIEASAGREWDRWFADRSLGWVVHKCVPVDAERWIGIVPLRASNRMR